MYETWEVSYKEIQKMAESEDSHKTNAANSAIILLELFPFFHHEETSEEIFRYVALPEDNETPLSHLPLASPLLDQRLLSLSEKGTWDNFIFREGIRILLSFSLTRRGPSDNVYVCNASIGSYLGQGQINFE